MRYAEIVWVKCDYCGRGQERTNVGCVGCGAGLPEFGAQHAKMRQQIEFATTNCEWTTNHSWIHSGFTS